LEFFVLVFDFGRHDQIEIPQLLTENAVAASPEILIIIAATAPVFKKL
jgi:hypothetical protein